MSVLSAQLNPHFFFNVMNTVSALMYEDLPRTERLIQDLGEVLRNTLRDDQANWSLAEEEAHARRFASLLDARFGDRLAVRWDVQPNARDAQLPRFALQVLIENAVKHNQASLLPLQIEVRAARDSSTLTLTVTDDGVGFRDAQQGAEHRGTGLSRLAEMLELLHGRQASLQHQNQAGGGARVALVLPYTVARP